MGTAVTFSLYSCAQVEAEDAEHTTRNEEVLSINSIVISNMHVGTLTPRSGEYFMANYPCL